VSIISRAEAAWRLKAVSAAINNAISGVREGHWRAGVEAAHEAQDLLDALIGHLDEAAEATPVEVENVRTGGLGYRGRSNTRTQPFVDSTQTTPVVHPSQIIPPATLAPPAPFKTTKVKSPLKPPPPIPRPIVTPPPAEVNPPAPIITPPPAPAYEPATVSIFPTEYDGVPPLTFDFARMLNQSDRDPDIINMHKLFLDLPENDRKALLAQFNKTGKPVTCKIRTQ